MAQVALRKIVKMFDKTPAVQGIDLDIADREFIVLVGDVEVDALHRRGLVEHLDDFTKRDLRHGSYPLVAPAVRPAM